MSSNFPQLDTSSFFSQSFWLFVFFFINFIFHSFLIIPFSKESVLGFLKKKNLLKESIKSILEETETNESQIEEIALQSKNFISDDYAVYNKTGGTRTSYTGSALPNGKIGTGQAFMVEAITATNVQFTNSMRNKTYSNSQFFRPATTAEIAEQNSQNRYWLNLKNSDGMFSQQLIGYIDQATYASDFAYDALVAQTKNYLSFYSTIGESNYRIQARPTFTETDEVPLGYFAAVSGQFTIELDATEGIFAQQNQPIYLEDRELNILHDLSQSPYSFTTNSGTYAQRFVIRYTPELAVNPFDTAAKTVQIFKRNNQLEVVSTQEEIERVEIYDLLGRKCFEKVGINATQYTVQEPINLSVVLVRVYLKSGLSCTKKIGF
jgi:hypothetical protein